MSVIFENGSSDLQFLCNQQTFLSLSTVIIAFPSSTMLFLMHSTDLASTLKSHFCSSNLHCARFWIGQTLFFLSTVINAHLCSYLFVICISQILLTFSTRQFCKLEFYFSVFMHCIALPLTLNSHYCASGFVWFLLVSFCKSCSRSQQSLLLIQAPFYYIYAFHGSASHSRQSLSHI